MLLFFPEQLGKFRQSKINQPNKTVASSNLAAVYFLAIQLCIYESAENFLGQEQAQIAHLDKR
jgi:hypothetical protein